MQLTQIHLPIVHNPSVTYAKQLTGLRYKLTLLILVLINPILPTTARATSTAQIAKKQVHIPWLSGGDLRRPPGSVLR